jgi:hypothetical protein
LDDKSLLSDELEFLGSILKVAFENEKSVSGQEVKYLGLLISIYNDRIVVRVSPARIRKLLWYVRDHLSRDSMTCGE